MPPQSLYLSPFESTDRMSMTAHLADLMPNVSTPLQGWITEKKRSQDRGTRGAGKGANGETKQGKVRGYAGVENDKGQRAFGIPMRQNGVMEGRRSCSKVEICTWLATGDKYAKRSSGSK